MKEALIKYREKNQKIDKNDSTNKNQSSDISTMAISDINTKNKFNKNNTIKLDKTILYYAEPRTKVKEFHKIQPKIIESFIADSQDDIDSFFENEYDQDNNGNNIEEKKIIYNNVSSTKYNKTIKMKNKKNKKKMNIIINEMNDYEETIINDNYEESLFNEFDKNKKQKKRNENNYCSDKVNNANYEKKEYLTEINDIYFNKSYLNIKNDDINYEYLLMTKKLYNELMKDIEINKMAIYENKLLIIKDILHIFNDDSNLKIYNVIDNISMNNNININDLNTINDYSTIKEFIIEQLIFFYIIILIGLIKKEKKNIFHSGLLNLSFYFNQNYIIFIYIIIASININSKDNKNGNNEIINNKKKCIEIIDENKTWLDNNNYKKYFKTNNYLIKQIIIKLLNQIKNYFNSNPLSINKNQKENISIYNNNNINQNEIIEKCINFFLSNIKSNENLTIINLIQQINNFSPINILLQLAKFDKKINHYNESIRINNNASSKNESEEFNIENNNIIEEMPPKEPFLKPINPKYKYTLVLDLDETLVHYISDNESAYIQIRPGAEDFIKELSEFYEIIIFTAALQVYADLVIDGIDPDGVISDRLYRQHTINVGNTNLKDLEKLGRDIKHVIIIDNFMENFSLQPKNGLNIIDFEGNEYDDELIYLKEDLLKLVKLNPDDVRFYLNDIQNNMDKRAIYFQKIKNENDLINYNDEDNNLFNGVVNNNNNNNRADNRNTEDIGKNNKKGYSYTEESENIKEDDNN